MTGQGDYHLQSLAFTMVCVAGLTLLCLATSFKRLPDDFGKSLRAWIVGTALVVLGDVLFVADVDIWRPQFVLSIVVGIGCAEWIHALRLFGGETKRLWWPYALVLAGGGVSASVGGYRATTIISSVPLAAIFFGAAVAAIKIKKPDRSAGRAVLTATFLILGFVMLTRIGIAACGVQSGAPPGYTSGIRALLFVISSIGPIAGSLAFVIMCNDRLGEELFRLATIDSLTGVLNRRAFLEETQRAISACRRREEPLALLTIDLDRFKNINDTAGHPAGDRVLVEVTRILERALRAEDLLGRMGGEEFGIAVPGASGSTAEAIAERVRTLVQGAKIEVASTPVLTVSVGVAATRDGNENIDTLIHRADDALYEAKRGGRNLVCLAP